MSAPRWCQTQSGREFVPSMLPNHPPPYLPDIIFGLSNLCRYNGHTSSFYSVAEHLVVGAKMAKWYIPGDGDMISAWLVHDMHKAYIGDMPSPLKSAIAGWAEFEASAEEWVRRSLCPSLIGSDRMVWDHVKTVDMGMLALEASQLMHVETAPGALAWGLPQPAIDLADSFFAEDPVALGGKSRWQIARDLTALCEEHRIHVRDLVDGDSS